MGGSIRRFIDVGANVGDWADAVLRASPSAEGILLEPSINASARLTSRFGNDRRIQMIAAAAGAAAGAVEFFEEPDAGVTSSVVPHQARGNAEPRRVPVLTLDAILAERGWDHVDVIKIDTEGYDDFVLAGAEGAIRDRRVDVIQFEYNAPWRDAGATLKRAMRRLSDGGYALYMLRPEGLFTLDDRYGEFFCLSNIVAIVPGREGGLASIVRGSM
jgi:FkbM family methyltransferase